MGRAKSVFLFMVKYRAMELHFQISILERDSRGGITLNPEDGFSLHSRVYIWFSWISPSCLHLSKGFSPYLSRMCQDCDGFLIKAVLLVFGRVHPHKTELEVFGDYWKHFARVWC